MIFAPAGENPTIGLAAIGLTVASLL